MSKDDFNSVKSNLEWMGFDLSKDDIEWLSEFDDPGDAHNAFLKELDQGDPRQGALTAAQRNI
jgi:hypothetical protein